MAVTAGNNQVQLTPSFNGEYISTYNAETYSPDEIAVQATAESGITLSAKQKPANGSQYSTYTIGQKVTINQGNFPYQFVISADDGETSTDYTITLSLVS